MSIKTIDAAVLSGMFLAGARNLEAKKEWINELNVFPVPDGDTGTNMTLTIMSAASEVMGLKDPDMDTLCKAISSGSLRGARGNSGVILSQLLRGFTRGIKGAAELDAALIAEAFGKAVETAYKAVMKPKEGTILTVARETAEKAAELCGETEEDLDSFFEQVFACAEETLKRTPELLPVLKEAGVVDSGGQGLVEVLRGAIDGFHGKEIDYSSFVPAPSSAKVTRISEETEKEIKFGYCTEFIVLLDKPLSEEEEFKFKDYLMSIGDSVVIVADDELVKVHVHTNHPGEVFEKGLTYGALSRMKVDNMREEHQEKLIKDAEKIAAQQLEEDKARRLPLKEYGFIAVSAGEGLSGVFKELGVDFIIEGGQTMNPSTEDMLNAIANVRAKTIYILPNNKNIVLAANQARDLTTDKEIVVVPTSTIPQGISAMISFSPEMSGEENLAGMEEAISLVKTGQITYAVRDTRVDEKEIHQGDAMGVGDHGILAVGEDRTEVSLATVEAMITEDSEVISVYYGGGVENDEAEALNSALEEKYPDMDIELVEGGQPIYYYIISVE